LKLRYNGPLSNFAFNFNLRRCNTAEVKKLLCADLRELLRERGGNVSGNKPALVAGLIAFLGAEEDEEREVGR